MTGPLKNARHEQFAQRIFKGESASDAYSSVYKIKGAAARVNASRLLSKANVSERIANLQSKTESKNVLSIQEKRELYALIVRTPIADIDENSILCASVKRITTDQGGSIEYKTLDKLKATELDTELAGHIKAAEAQSLTVNVGVAVTIMTEEKLKQISEKKRIAIEQRQADRHRALGNG